MGEQERTLPYRSPHHHYPTANTRHCQLFWHCQRRYFSTCRAIPSCPTRPQWEQVDLSPMCGQCQARTGQPHAREERRLQSHSRGTAVARNMVYPGDRKGSGEGVQGNQNSRGVAFLHSNAMVYFETTSTRG